MSRAMERREERKMSSLQMQSYIDYIQYYKQAACSRTPLNIIGVIF